MINLVWKDALKMACFTCYSISLNSGEYYSGEYYRISWSVLFVCLFVLPVEHALALCALYKECPRMEAHEQIGSVFGSGVIVLSGNTEQA